MIKTAPLSQMQLSDHNPRKAPPQDDVEIMVASIRAEGLLTPLLAYETAEGHIAVVDGGTRLFALRQIADAAGDNPEVPFTLISEADALNKAMTAQAVRRDLPPVAEMRAYQAAIVGGAEIAAIAASWGQSERYVRQRLALSALPDIILAALEAGDIPLYCADAFASAGDKAADMWTEFEATARNYPRDLPRRIRLALDFQEADSRRAKMLDAVGEQAFVEAGGVVERDLFSTAIRLQNTDALEKLYSEFLGTRASGHAQAAGFANWRLDTEGGAPKGSVAIHPQYVGLTDDERARESELQEREDDLSAEEEDELQALYDKANTRVWSDDAKRLAILEVYEGRDDVASVSAVIPKENLEAAYEAGLVARPAKASKAAAGDAGEGEETRDGYSASLIVDLMNLRVDVARDQITDKPDLAQTILAWALRCGAWRAPLDISFRDTPRSGLIEEDSAIRGWAPDAPGHHLPLAEAEKMGKASRNRVIAGFVATTLQGPALDEIAPYLDIDIRAAWTPDEAFLKRLRHDALVRITTDLGADHIKTETMNKKDLVEALVGVFADPPKAIAEKVNRWLPPVLRPAAAADAEDKAAAA